MVLVGEADIVKGGEEMAVRTAQEIMGDLEFLNDGDTAELYVKLLEDIKDSVAGDVSEIRSKLEEAEKKAEEVEKQWRERYIERFGGLSEDTPEKEEVEEVEEVEETYSDEEIIDEWKE